MLKTALIACALLAATPTVAATPSPAEIEKAERAFAADGVALGIRDSFLAHMADDAIVFSPGPVSAKALYEKRPSSKTPKLEWWPQRVVIARSGDLGLSVGPWAINDKRGAYYATIWRKGPDGTWKWVYDGGGDADGAKGPDPATPAVQGPIAVQGAGSPAAGFAQARAAEDQLAKAAAQDAASAYDAALSLDALLTGPGGTKALAVDDLAGRRKLRPAVMVLTPVGGGASKAGDLVWIHGQAHWNGDGPKPVAAHYMHVWQKRADGWRLIFETLINDT
jgi:ketosteroid isomerase-like protein